MAGPAAPRRFVITRWLVVAAIVLVLGVAGVFFAVRYGPMTQAGRSLIESQVSGLKAGRFGTLKIEGLGGDIWNDFTLARLSIADRQGVWLEARGISVRWKAAALLNRRLRLTSIIARSVTIERRPLLTRETKPTPSPVSVDVVSAATRLEMGPAFAARRGLYDLRTAFSVERAGGVRGWASAASALHVGD